MFNRNYRLAVKRNLWAVLGFAVVIILPLFFDACGGSGRHSGGVFDMLPNAGQDTGAASTNNPANTPTGQYQYSFSPGNSKVSSPLGLPKTYKIASQSVSTAWTNHQPENDTTVLGRAASISVKLQLLLSNAEQRESVGDMKIGRAMLDAQEVPATLSSVDDGYTISLPEQSLAYEGMHAVFVLLFDANGCTYTHEWHFNSIATMPTVQHVGMLVPDNVARKQDQPGYAVYLDQPLASGLYELFSDPANWQLTHTPTGANLLITGVAPVGNCSNEVVLFTADACYDSKELNATFIGSFPGMQTRQASEVTRSASWIDHAYDNPECDDCTGPVTPNGLELTEAELEAIIRDKDDDDLANQPLSQECCDAAVCTVYRTHEYQCCDASITIDRAIECATCTTVMVFRKDAQYRGDFPRSDEPLIPRDPSNPCDPNDPRGTYLPTHCPPHPAGPGPYDQCGSNSFEDHRGNPNCGMPQLEYVDGVENVGQWIVHASRPIQDGVGIHFDFRPDWTSKYKVEIGTWVRNDQKDPPYDWCPAWRYNEFEVKGDHKNPSIEPTIIGGDAMLAELTDIAVHQMIDPLNYGHIQCERYYGNEYAEFDQLLNEYESGCGKVLKITLKDECLNGARIRPFILTGDRFRLPALLFTYQNNIPVFDNPDYFDSMSQINWALTGQNLQLAYICDYTKYPNCADEDAENTEQYWTFYYLIARDLHPLCQILPGGSQYGNDINNPINPAYESCDTYLAWPFRDHAWSGPTGGTDWNKGCGILELKPEAEWVTQVTLYKHHDGRMIDPDLHFYQEELPNNGCKLHPYTENYQPVDPEIGYLEVISPQEIQDGVPFAIFMEAERDGSTYGSALQTPQLFIDFEGTGVWAEPRNPKRFCEGFDDGNCAEVQSSVWVFDCERPAMTDIDIKTNTDCNLFRFRNITHAYDIDIDVLDDVPAGSLVYTLSKMHRVGKWIDLNFVDVLTNPCVSGDDRRITWNLFQQCKGPYGNYKDGPVPFALARAKCCKPPDWIKVYIDMNSYVPIEVAKYHIDVGNAYEQGDSEVANNHPWPDFINQQEPSRAYVPVYIWYQSNNSTQRPTDEPQLALHNDFADDNDPYDDIVRTYPNPINVIQPTDPQTEFTIAWDGRQWLLDEGVEKYSSDAWFERSIYNYWQVGDDITTPTMCPPGSYRLVLEASFPEGISSTDLGYINLAYGGEYINSLVKDSGYVTFYDEMKAGYTSFGMTGFIYGSYADLGTSPPQPGYVTLYTSSEFINVLQTYSHSRRWFKQHLLWPEYVKKDLVVLNECYSWHYDYIGEPWAGKGFATGGTSANPNPQFNTKIIIGWASKSYPGYCDYWFSNFYDYLFGRNEKPQKSILDSYISANDLQLHNPEFSGERRQDEQTHGNVSWMCPELAPRNNTDELRFIYDSYFEKTNQWEVE